MRKFVVEISLVGDYISIENNIDLIVSSVDPLGLDSCEISIRNESDLNVDA